MKAIPAVAWMELSGVNVDLKKLDEIKSQIFEQKNNAEKILIKELTRVETTQQTSLGGQKIIVPKANQSSKVVRGT